MKSEGVSTMDVSTVSERPSPPSPDQATGELKDREMNASQNASEKSDAKRDTCSIVDTEAKYILSDGNNETSNDSKKCKDNFRMCKTKDKSSPMHEGGGEQCTLVQGSTALNIAVMIESRTKNSSPDSAPAVVVEGETDSDDTCEEGGLCDESHDCEKESHDDGLLCSQYFRDIETQEQWYIHIRLCLNYSLSLSLPLSSSQIKQANFWGENWVLSGSDCGHVFLWDKWSGRVVNMLMADSCCQLCSASSQCLW